jgi:hypothetical protein
MKRAADLFEKLKALVLKANTERDMKRARTCYAIGEVLNKLVPERSTSGKSRISQLAERLKTKSPNLYHCREFAQECSPTEWKQLKTLAPNLSFGHVVALLSVEKATDRKKYATLNKTDDLSVKALRRRIQQDLGSQSTNNNGRRGIGGRTVSECATPEEAWNAFLDDLRVFSSHWQVRQKQIEKHSKSLSVKERRKQLGNYPSSFKAAASEIQELLAGRKSKNR